MNNRIDITTREFQKIQREQNAPYLSGRREWDNDEIEVLIPVMDRYNVIIGYQWATPTPTQLNSINERSKRHGGKIYKAYKQPVNNG
jgi:hypothetical protein